MVEANIQREVAPGRLLLPLGMAVCLSLLGDLTLYAVLPMEREVVGLSLGAVGMMLAVNRLIRIPGNLVAGALVDGWGRRRLFLVGMVLGVLTTAAYGIVHGFWPFLIARLLWGVGWMLINVSGMTMVLDVSTAANRGRLMGSYNTWMLSGFALGPLVGGALVNALGFRRAMVLCAAGTAVGLGVAVLGVPETGKGVGVPFASMVHRWWEGMRLYVASAALLEVGLLYLLTLFGGDGVVSSTLSLWLVERVRGPYLTALGGGLAGARALVGGAVGPLAGWAADRLGRRRPLIIWGLLTEAVGLAALAFAATPWGIALTALLSAVGDGTLRANLSAAVGDLAGGSRAGAAMGMFATIGDVGASLGPLAAYALLARVGLRWVYLMSAAGFALALGGYAVHAHARGGRQRAGGG